MSKNGRCLLVGAGAESAYGLPTGNQFTWETCYTKNAQLYAALGEYYSARLGSERLPNRYERQFLYRATNQQFKLLIAGMLPDQIDLDSEGAKSLDSLLGDDWLLDQALYERAKASGLSQKQYEHLFKELIASSDDSSAQRNLINFAREKLPQDSYFGTIESYFSSLIDPVHRSGQFWKLINYYWTAFFAVASPLLKSRYSNSPDFKKEGLYAFTLNRLNDVVGEIGGLWETIEQPGGSYYELLTGDFNAVITTNYTGLCNILAPDIAPVHISGAIWQFEAPESLSIRDIRKEPVGDSEFVFPYLLTQAPIKPIIGWSEADDLRQTLNVLDDTVSLFVLGYSFCSSDAHVASLVGSWLKGEPERQLHFFYHAGLETSEGVCRRLRIDAGYSNQVFVHSVNDIKAIVCSL